MDIVGYLEIYIAALRDAQAEIHRELGMSEAWGILEELIRDQKEILESNQLFEEGKALSDLIRRKNDD